MRSSDLKQLLFDPITGQETAFFRSQRELANMVAAQSHYGQKREALFVFLNQVLLGKRPCPAELTDAIVRVVRQVGDERGLAPPLLDRIDGDLRRLLPQSGNDPVERLLARQLGSREVVVVNPEPLEERAHPRSAEFQEAMVRTIRLGEGRYTFVLDDSHPLAITKFWRATLQGLARIPTPADAVDASPAQSPESQLRAIVQDRRLTVYRAPSHLCIVPLVAFDPHLPDRCEVYVWDWWLQQGSNAADDQIARLSPRIMFKWLQDFYEGILMAENSPFTRLNAP